VGEKKEKNSQQVGERRRKNLSEFPSALVGRVKKPLSMVKGGIQFFLQPKFHGQKILLCIIA